MFMFNFCGRNSKAIPSFISRQAPRCMLLKLLHEFWGHLPLIQRAEYYVQIADSYINQFGTKLFQRCFLSIGTNEYPVRLKYNYLLMYLQTYL